MKTVSKEQEVASLLEKFSRSKGMVFTDFRGLTAPEMVALRRALSQNGLEYRVVKNTLAAIAAKQAGISVDSFLDGPTGIVFSYADPISVMRLAVELARRFERQGRSLKIKGGLVEGQTVGPEEVKQLAQLPTRHELLGQLAGALQAPISNLVFVLNALIREFVLVLDEIVKKKQEIQTSTNTQSEGGGN